MRKGIDCRGKEWEENVQKLRPEKDLTGHTFGKLTVLFRVQNDKQGLSYWLCLCECGNEIVARGSSLRNGHTASCGCAQRLIVSETLTKSFKIGEQVGYWTVLHKADGYLGRGAYWHCRCVCGAERDVCGEHLRMKNSVSCGCVQSELTSERHLIDLTGRRFGLLTVIERSDKKVNYGDVYWRCRCDCGNSEDISGHGLRRGSTISCGCLSMSNGEYHISEILKQNNINYVYNRAYFDDLMNNEGNLLRNDFVILDDNNCPYRIVEFDGKQHDEPLEFFGGADRFEQLKHNDLIKNQYALSHNIPLVRIPYSKRDTMTYDDIFGDKYLIKGDI